MFQTREMQESDWQQVKVINQLGMDTNIATFQRECPPHEEFDRSHLNECRLVAVDGDAAIGWRTPS